MEKICIGFVLLCFVSCVAASRVKPSLQGGGVPNLKVIKDVCSGFDDKEFCVTSLRNPPKSVDIAATSNDIGAVALAAAYAKASSMVTYTKAKLKSGNLGPSVEDAIDDCYKSYQDAGDQLEDSMAALTTKAYHDVDFLVNAAMSAAETCGSALGSVDGVDRKLSRRNANFLKLCRIALMINKKYT